MAEDTARPDSAERAGSDDPVVLINVFEVPADQVDAAIAEWRQRAEIMAGMPGFLGYRLHKAMTADARFQLVNVARWASQEHWEAAIANPDFQARIRDLRGGSGVPLAANPALYRVVAEQQAD